MKHTASHTATAQDVAPVTAMGAFRTLTLGFHKGSRQFVFKFPSRAQKETYLSMLERNKRRFENSIEGNTVTTIIKEA